MSETNLAQKDSQKSWWRKAVSFAFDRNKILTIADINNIISASGVVAALRTITGENIHNPKRFDCN